MERCRVEDVGLDGARAQAVEDFAAAGGPRHARDLIAGGEHLAHGALPDYAGGSGDDDLVHAQVTTYPTRT